jgi:serine/threonine protein kinase
VLGAGLAEALSHVHGLGLVHRDVKPSNVLLTMDGPRLIDFGIARATDGTASLTSTGVSIGSPGYMSPEQILGKGITGAADVFSLGAVLVYAATGDSPFPGDSSAALLYKVVHEPPELGGMDGELRSLAEACLAKDAAARPAPDEVARHLAPEGANRLVTAGWLPGPLVERVSRSAVRLLDLDTGPDLQTGPVGFSSPSVGGVFGPPDASYGAPVIPAVPQPADAPPEKPPGKPEMPEKPGKLSLSVAATSVPEGPNGRGRRLSCTVALAVAGALAAVTVGSVFVFNLMPGSGSDDDSSDAGQQQPPAATGAPQPSATGDGGQQPGEVPDTYVGKWTGKASAADGTVPLGTFDVTLKQVKPGGRLGTVTQNDPIGNTCVDELTLKSASKKEVVATGRGAKSNGGQCSQATHTVRLSLDGKVLRYTSQDPKAGNPAAELTRRE